ncbi:hypothetical protein INT43_003604 [Umbelopsis isabellina]|uniref:Ubiquitin-like protease family profile domain-containing protein n=1 Tax=Mortierella isabellina TaxID=91625 RepID=A0A8H7PV76_MORIS|nr:hypothetical protein INT43_003604 [Umbelopsis isabellina]
MDSDANPEDDENRAKLQSTTLRNQFQLIEHRYKNRRGTPINLPSAKVSTIASTSFQRRPSTSRQHDKKTVPQETALLPPSLNKIVRTSTTKDGDQTSNVSNGPKLSHNDSNSTKPISIEIPKVNDDGRHQARSKSKRNSMVEISSDEEDHQDKRRNSVKRVAPSIIPAQTEPNKDDSIISKPLVLPHRRASVISRMLSLLMMSAQKRRNGGDVEIQPPSVILKKRRSSAEILGSERKAVESVLHRPETSKSSIVVAEDPEDSTSSSEKVHSPETTPPKQIDSDEILFVYPFTGYGGITVSKADEARLDDGEFLNDSIIDFYMKWILDQLQSRNPELAGQVHIFNSFFYKRLTQRNPNASKSDSLYERVKKWTSKINLFDKTYVFIPINENWHWYLAVICNLNQMVPSPKVVQQPSTVPLLLSTEDETSSEPDSSEPIALHTPSPMDVDEATSVEARTSSPRTRSTPTGIRTVKLRSDKSTADNEASVNSPWIFLLDSLGNRHPKALQCLQQYLQAEAKERMGFDIEQDGCKPISQYGKVPRQRNYCDCGVYLLHYVELFLSDPQKYLTLLAERRDGQQEWAPTEAHDKRQKIRQVIQDTAEVFKALPT